MESAIFEVISMFSGQVVSNSNCFQPYTTLPWQNMTLSYEKSLLLPFILEYAWVIYENWVTWRQKEMETKYT